MVESATIQAMTDYRDNETVASPDHIHALSQNDQSYMTDKWNQTRIFLQIFFY